MIRIISIKKAKRILGVTRKELKGLMIDQGWITSSWSAKDDSNGYVAEICTYHSIPDRGIKYTETTLVLTVAGMNALIHDKLLPVTEEVHDVSPRSKEE